MALINAESTSPQAIYNAAITALQAHQAALATVKRVQGWLAGVADADLLAIGCLQADITAMRSALLDADAERQLYEAGTLPNTYVLPYTFSASQVRFIGPRF
jgi:hypothetical protein